MSLNNYEHNAILITGPELIQYLQHNPTTVQPFIDNLWSEDIIEEAVYLSLQDCDSTKRVKELVNLIIKIVESCDSNFHKLIATLKSVEEDWAKKILEILDST